MNEPTETCGSCGVVLTLVEDEVMGQLFVCENCGRWQDRAFDHRPDLVDGVSNEILHRD